MVIDGTNSKATRRTFLPQYKAGRDKAPEVSEQLNIARDRVSKMALHLGMRVIQQKSYEADDVIGYLCKHLRSEPIVVCTADGDLSVLVDDMVSVWRLGEMNVNPCGPFPHKYIRLYKSLVGDTSDKIPGAKGFGDAAWVDMVRTFGLEGLDMMIELIENNQIKRLAEDVADFKPLQKIIDAEAMVSTSWRVAGLMTDQINTMRKPWDLRAGMVAQWAELPDELRVHDLHMFYGTKTLVTAGNYDRVYEGFANRVNESPFVALDIETSSSEESDEWIERVNSISEKTRGNKLDVLGHELTGMSLTFGANTQHTFYMSVGHKDTDNITVDQCMEMVELIPGRLHTIIQNRQFEFSVLYRTWGDKWEDNGWHGLVPNALDTKIGASYVSEDVPKGLKERSKLHLGYTQQTYEQTTTKSGALGFRKGGVKRREFDQEVAPAVYKETVIEIDDEWVDDDGEIHQSKTEQVVQELVTAPVVERWESRQFKMNELTGREVLDYGCDDTICTAALHSHYWFIMELENTLQVFLDVETLPEYLTSLAFVQGIPVSMGKLRQMEKADDVRYEKAWAHLREFLMRSGWDGTECPEFEGDIEPSDVKLALPIILDGEFATKKRKLVGIAFDIREQFPNNDRAELLAAIVERNDVNELNKLVRQHFDGEPKINFSSPKQMQNLFYNVLGIKPRILNKMTPKQRDENKVMREAFTKFRKIKDGKDLTYTKEEHEALISKSSTDDDAVASALALDDLTPERKAVLEAYQTVRSIGTRRSLFYKPYKVLTHWRDGRLHPSLNQSEAATRRHSSSAPNVQQMEKGEGGIREVILPHADDCVVVSLDLSGQELRLQAELSGDEAMTSCYVGDNKRDMHHLTAVAATVIMWGYGVHYDDFVRMLESDDKEIKSKAKALRADAKTTNFATAYGAMAPKIALTLMTDEETAQAFIDAKEKAFPRLPEWNKEVQEIASRRGYSLTMLGARRHLAEGLNAESKWDRMAAERQAGNFEIQGSGGEMLKLAMARMWSRGIFAGKYRAKFYAPIHDEVVFSCHRDDLIAVLKEVHPCMIQQYATMKIPLESSISIGPTFGTQYEIGTTIDEAKIAEALAKIFGG
jgi:DNA polymerase I-like protein with 3'-5' exonuclease and polymerase domains/5'-3' exonuclease